MMLPLTLQETPFEILRGVDIVNITGTRKTTRAARDEVSVLDQAPHRSRYMNILGNNDCRETSNKIAPHFTPARGKNPTSAC